MDHDGVLLLPLLVDEVQVEPKKKGIGSNLHIEMAISGQSDFRLI